MLYLVVGLLRLLCQGAEQGVVFGKFPLAKIFFRVPHPVRSLSFGYPVKKCNLYIRIQYLKGTLKMFHFS